MLILPAAPSLQSFLSHAAMLPLAGGVFAGLTFALFRSPAHPFNRRDSQSLMNFSSLGSLRCICSSSHSEKAKADRREFCRSCGCEVIAPDKALLDQQLSKGEARKITRELRDAAIRTRDLDLPASIASIAQLNSFLASNEKRSLRPKRTKQSAEVLEQPQVH